MSCVRADIETLAGPFDGNRKGWLARAARQVSGVSYRTIKSFWYGEIENPNHLAAQVLRREAALKQDRAARRKQNEQEAINEIEQLRERLARLEEILVPQNADLGRS